MGSVLFNRRLGLCPMDYEFRSQPKTNRRNAGTRPCKPNMQCGGAFLTDVSGVQINSSSPSFHNSRALLSKVDSLPTGPEWEVIELLVKGKGVNGNGEIVTENVELWRRDPVECVRELFSNPAFKNSIHYEPQKVYTDESKTERVFGEMWMGQWWWETQVSVMAVQG